MRHRESSGHKTTSPGLEPLFSGLDVLQTYLTSRNALTVLAFDHDLPEVLGLSPPTAPRLSRPLLLLCEGLPQLALLLLGQVGRDDLKVVCLQLIDHPLRRCRPAGQGKQG